MSIKDQPRIFQFFFLIVFFLIVMVFGAIDNRKISYASHTNFDPNNLIDDGPFIDIDSLTANEVQVFLEQQNSFLKDYSENGKTAAQIIWEAAHGYGEGSGTIAGIAITRQTGTVNPRVILVTLEKEQSLISRKTRDDNALRKAMGYGCPDDGGCNAAYSGFTKQVENGAWQLRFNYERAQGRGFSNYQVGQSQIFSNSDGTTTEVTFSNRATAALYRYTPHVYNGNHNFHYLWQAKYNFVAPMYDYRVVDQSQYPNINPGQSARLYLRVKNVGSAVWTKSQVRLGTDRPGDRIPGFIREDRVGGHDSGWVGENRIKMQELSVKPGETATFVFWYTATDDKPPGEYFEYFNLVADGVTWLPSKGVYWKVAVPGADQIYVHNVVDQNGYPTLRQGQSYNLVVKIRNTGQSTWQRSIVRLGTDRPGDRIPGFIREDRVGGHDSGWVGENRIKMQEGSVSPGETATFSFWYTVTADKPPGTYREYFRPVADGIAWMTDYGIYWDITVIN